MKRNNRYFKKKLGSRIKLTSIALAILLVPVVGTLAYNNTLNAKPKEEVMQVSNKEESVQEAVVKPQDPPKPIYDEKFGIGDNHKKFGALPESANKYGYSSLKVQDILERGFEEDKFLETDGEKIIFLTFDDGPSQNTLKILDILDKYGVKATFFVLGKEVEENPDILKKTYERGHAIANHTYSHIFDMGINTFKKEISRCSESIKKVLGEDFETRTVRHPGGFWYKNLNYKKPLSEYIKSENMAMIDWNTLSGDADAEPVVKNENTLLSHIIEEAKDYKTLVALMHDTDAKNVTVKMLPKAIEYFKEREFKFKILI